MSVIRWRLLLGLLLTVVVSVQPSEALLGVDHASLDVTLQAPQPPNTPSSPAIAPPGISPPETAAVGGPGRLIPSGSSTLLASGANVAIIKVQGLIYDFTLQSLQRRVDRAVLGGASLIVIELDTPGGVATSALKISKYIKTMRVPTVAWVNSQAYSAGIMIAGACNQIVMAPSSATGDCAPIVPGQNLAPTERAKALSPLLEEFRDSARANGYDYALFHAMCVLGVEVYQVQNPDTGEVRCVNQADYGVMVDGKAMQGAWLTKALGRAIGTEQTGVGAATVSVATESDRGKWELVSKVHDGHTLLTLNQQRALEVGLAKAIVRDIAELEQTLGAASIVTIPPSFVAQTAYWLTQPWVRALLMMVVLVGAYLELQTPGLGVGGFFATGALVVLIGAPWLVGLAQVWHIGLFAVGVLLILVEVLIIPGFGLPGIAGIVCMFTGLVLMVVPTTGQGAMPLPAQGMADQLRNSILFTMVGIVGSGIGFYYITKYLHVIPVFNRLTLRNVRRPVGDRDKEISVSGGEVIGYGRIKVGDVGRAVTGLHPIGRGEFDGQTIDVVSLGQWIDPGQPVRVVEVHGNRIVVEEGSDKPG